MHWLNGALVGKGEYIFSNLVQALFTSQYGKGLRLLPKYSVVQFYSPSHICMCTAWVLQALQNRWQTRLPVLQVVCSEGDVRVSNVYHFAISCTCQYKNTTFSLLFLATSWGDPTFVSLFWILVTISLPPSITVWWPFNPRCMHVCRFSFRYTLFPNNIASCYIHTITCFIQ